MKAIQFGKGVLITGVFFGIFFGVSLGGCMMPPQVHPPMGDSVRETIARQIANPAAGDEVDNGTGMDGQAAEKSMESYRKAFEPKKKSTSTNITINQ